MSELNQVLWVMQGNALGEGHVDSESKLALFLELQGTCYRTCEVRPFDDSPIDAGHWDGPVIFRGSTLMVERVAKHGGYKPGVWYDRENGSFEALLAGYGDLLLNADSEVVPLGKLLARDWAPDRYVFVRPAEDLKEFVGGVRRFDELPELLQRGNKSRASEETRIQVAEPKNITREWRTIVVDGQAITGSQYRAHGRAMAHGDFGTIPEEVLAFSTRAAQQYQPAPVFVLDVGERTDGSLKIVECNCFNCAGLYWSDYHMIALSVTAFAARSY